MIKAAYGTTPNGPSSPNGPRLSGVSPAEMLRKTCLTYARLERMNMGDAGVVSLAQELASGVPQLKSLYLGSNGIGDEGALALAEAIRHRQSHLRKLFLQDNELIGCAGYKALKSVCAARECELIGLTPPPPQPPPPPPQTEIVASPAAPLAVRAAAEPPSVAPRTSVDLLACNRATRRRSSRHDDGSTGEDEREQAIRSRSGSRTFGATRPLEPEESTKWARLSRPQQRYLNAVVEARSREASPPRRMPPAGAIRR